MHFTLGLRELLQTLCPAPSTRSCAGVGRIHPGSSGISQHGKGSFASCLEHQGQSLSISQSPLLCPCPAEGGSSWRPPLCGDPKGIMDRSQPPFIPGTGASLWHQGLSNCHPEPALPQLSFTKLCPHLLPQNHCWAFIPSAPLGREQTCEQESKAGRN